MVIPEGQGGGGAAEAGATSEIYARSDVPLANGTFTPGGRLVVSHHPAYETLERVSIFSNENRLERFPNERWNDPTSPPAERLDAVQGLRTDSRGRVWLLDMGTRSGIPAKFVVWNPTNNELERLIELPASALTPHSEPNDFVIDERTGFLYIADEGAGNGGDGSDAALIVVNAQSGEARRRLQGRPGIHAEESPLLLGGRELLRSSGEGKAEPFRVGVDGIALDHAGEWLYYGPLTGAAMWRVRTRDLLNDTLSDGELQSRVERYADRPNSGGMWMDARGDLYITEVAGRSIGRIPRGGGKYERVLTSGDLYWPDDVIPGPGGALYVIVSQLPAAPGFEGGRSDPELPFVVVRFKP